MDRIILNGQFDSPIRSGNDDWALTFLDLNSTETLRCAKKERVFQCLLDSCWMEYSEALNISTAPPQMSEDLDRISAAHGINCKENWLGRMAVEV